MTSTSTTTPPPASNPTPTPYLAVNLADKLSRLHEHWSQRVVAEMNDYQFKIAKLQGDFVWHSHADTDEAFLVVAGELRIDFRDGAVTLRAGDMFVVPRGVEHKPFAQSEAHVLLVEPRGVVNTGDAQSDRTRPNDLWA
ncbi:cupin domain-containing protein [Variovorax sp. RCC_210]|uniref:cupin domain-containing protein n=1 Tax=Variovorax sp. RCC_210 TaxID=3239217 RepID=UPI00352542B7